MVCTVSFQSSRLLCALVRFVSLWQAWQFSVAMAFPSPSGNSTTTALAGALAPGAAASGEGARRGGSSRRRIRGGSGVLGAKILERDTAPKCQSYRPGCPRLDRSWCESYLSSRPGPCALSSNWSAGGTSGNTRWQSVCRRLQAIPRASARGAAVRGCGLTGILSGNRERGRSRNRLQPMNQIAEQSRSRRNVGSVIGSSKARPKSRDSQRK